MRSHVTIRVERLRGAVRFEVTEGLPSLARFLGVRVSIDGYLKAEETSGDNRTDALRIATKMIPSADLASFVWYVHEGDEETGPCWLDSNAEPGALNVSTPAKRSRTTARLRPVRSPRA